MVESQDYTWERLCTDVQAESLSNCGISTAILHQAGFRSSTHVQVWFQYTLSALSDDEAAKLVHETLPGLGPVDNLVLLAALKEKYGIQ